jgi:hypothetical protein
MQNEKVYYHHRLPHRHFYHAMKAAFTSLAALLLAPLAEHDIAAKQPGKMDELKTLFQMWSDEVDADSRKLGVEPQNAKDQ